MSVATLNAVPASPSSGARGALFLAILLIGWVTLSPFPDLGTADTVQLGAGNDATMYIVFGGLAAAATALIWPAERPALRALAAPSFLALLGWIVVTCVTSQDPATSMKRVTLTGFAATCSLALFLLPRDRDELARLLSVVALIILVVSYLGVLFVPHLAVHQASDVGEPQLAGDWRGLFGHKNMASAMFSLIAFIGLFVLRAGRREGWFILAASLLFVVESGGKSSTAICLLVLLLSVTAMRVRNPVLWSLLVFAPVALLNALGVGAIAWPALDALTRALPLDTTFTGRTDIWALAIPHAIEKPVFGHGLNAFWNTEALRYGMEQSTIWAGGAEHAHNGYLDAIIAMGLPGLAVVVWAFMVQPARDLRRCAARGDEPALTLMLLQIWMFSLYLSALETFFFERANAQWIAFLFALFGARLLASFRLVHRGPAADAASPVVRGPAGASPTRLGPSGPEP